jgi:CheY-like chemotaxis protein
VSEPAAPERTENKNILVVEDDPMMLQFVSLLLQGLGHSVTEAMDGQQMFQALSAQKFDLIVLDIMLPDGNGVEFARKLRRDGGSEPILFATGVTDTETRRHAIGLMQVDYVTKPFQAEELTKRVNGMFGGPRIMNDPVVMPAPPPVPDAKPIGRRAMIWGPALALVIVLFAGIFVLPKDDDPLVPSNSNSTLNQLSAAQSQELSNAAKIAARDGLLIKDATNNAAAPRSGGSQVDRNVAAQGADAGGDLTPDQKVAQGCGELPVSPHWNNNSVKRILRYVRFIHGGDWGDYIKSWEVRLQNVQDLHAQGKPIVLKKKDIVLAGDELESYASLMEKRLNYFRCAERIFQTLN